MKTMGQITKEILGYTLKNEPTDVLPLLRENIDTIWPLCDDALSKNLQPEAFTGGSDLRVISYCFADDEEEVPYIANHESDYVVFSYTYKSARDWGCDDPAPPTADEVMEIIAIILLSDCSGCCNAHETTYDPDTGGQRPLTGKDFQEYAKTLEAFAYIFILIPDAYFEIITEERSSIEYLFYLNDKQFKILKP